jgi:hypothetical protein
MSSPSAGTYDGAIPVSDLYIGHMLDGAERRGQGSDYVHEFMRLGSAEDRGKMNQTQALGYRTTVESGSGLTRRESNKFVEA